MSESEVFLFPDTNVFMHYRMFNEVEWPALVGGSPVVICLSRTVTKELEEKKYDQKLSSRKRDRVRKVSTKIDQILDAGGTVRSQVRLQIVKHPAADTTLAGLDLAHADDAHVAAAYQLKLERGADVRVVSADTNLRNSARTVGVGLLKLPDELALPPEPDDADVELKRLRAENERLKAVPRPKLSVEFKDGTTTVRVPAFDWRQLGVGPSELSPVLERVVEAIQVRSVFAPSRSAIRKYRERAQAHEQDLAATVGLELALFNRGEAPAKGVHVELSFPSEFLLRDEMPEEPVEPTSPFELDIATPALVYQRLPEEWSITGSNAELSRRQVVHSLRQDLPTLYARPSQPRDLKTFLINGRIVTSEPPHIQVFQLQVVVETDEDEDEAVNVRAEEKGNE